MKHLKISFTLHSTLYTLSSILYTLFFPLSVRAENIIGGIPNPLPKYPSTQGQGLFAFLSNILKLVGTVAGIFMIVQLILAGIGYISASGDPKKTEQAWAKIYQSLIGIVIISSAFVLAAVVERITGIKILNPTIYGP